MHPKPYVKYRKVDYSCSILRSYRLNLQILGMESAITQKNVLLGIFFGETPWQTKINNTHALLNNTYASIYVVTEHEVT